MTLPRLDNARVIRAPHGLKLSAKSWQTEAPLRMLMNNLDPAVAEKPHELVVYGGIGRAARDWGSFDRIVAALRNLEAGRALEGRLDAVESIGPLLTTVFAIEGRVRPYNKWLRHELAIRPLVGWDPLPVVERLVTDPRPAIQREAMRVVERSARAAGHGAVVDGWAPELAWVRGDAG